MSKKLSFRTDIQGLRAIAVLSVMLFHYDRQLLPGGFIGVDVFFVISGFLITSILLKAKESKDFSLFKSLKRFYIGRAKRIAPAYYVFLAVVAVISAVLFTAKDFSFFKNSLVASLPFASNIYFSGFGDYFAPKSDELPLLHTWSLAIEMQFYFFYPFLILLLKERTVKKIILILILGLLIFSSYQINLGQAQNVYYGLYARIPEFLIGGCVVLFAEQFKKISQQWFSVVGLILIFASFFLISEKTPFPGLYAVPCVVGAALILSNVSGKATAQWLSYPVLVWVGAVSYSLYLWHWPLLAFIRYASGNYELTLVQSICYWGGAFMLASISYYWIEQKFRQKKPVGTFAKISWSVLVVFVLVIIFLSPKLNKSIIPTLPVELTRYADPATICHGKIVGDCIRGDRNSTEKPILVLGDSHAAMLNIFFDEIGAKEHLAFRVITGSSCVTIRNFDYQRIAEWAHNECLQQISEADKKLSTSDTVILAALWNYHIDSKDFKQALTHFLEANQDKNILLLADIPGFVSYEPLRAQRLAQLGIDVAEPVIDKKTQTVNEQLKNIADLYENVKYVDLATNNRLFVNRAVYDSKIIYHDANHLNEIGSKLYAEFGYEKISSYLSWLSGKGGNR